MADAPTTPDNNLVVAMLREVRAVQDQHTRSFSEVKERLGLLEAQYASVSRRIDRMDERLGRVETRWG